MFTLASHTARVRSSGVDSECWKGSIGLGRSHDKIWDLRKGTLERTLTGHTDAIRAMAFCPMRNVSFRLRTIIRSRLEPVLPVSQEACIDTQLDWVRGLVVLPQTPFVASISDDRTVKLWNLAEHKVVRALRGHVAEVSCAAAMPDGKSLITGSDDRTLRIWTIDCRVAAILKGHAARITAVAVSANGSIVSVAGDGTARLWTNGPDWQSQVLNWKLPGARSATFTPDANAIVAAVDDSNVHIWDLTMEHERVLEGHSDWVNCVTTSPDGRYVVSGSDDGTLKLWDRTRNSATSVARDHADRVRAVAITADGRTAVSTSDDHTLRIWNTTDRTVSTVVRNQHHWVFASVPGSRNLICSGASGSCFAWNIDSGQELCRFSGHQDRVRSLAVTPDGARVISGGDDRTIRVWDIQSGNQILEIPLLRQWPRSIAITSDGRFAITAAESSSLKLWDLITGGEVRSFRGHTARVNAIAMASEKRLVSASDDHTVRVWDLESGQLLHVLTNHDGKVNALATLPGGRLIASASDDCDVKLWDVVRGLLIATFTVESPVLTCAGNPTAAEIIAGDRSGLVHFFAVEEGSCERTAPTEEGSNA